MFTSSSRHFRIAGLALLWAIAAVPSRAQDPAAAKASGTNAAPAAAASAKAHDTPPAKVTKKPKLTGSELYAIHCNRCHPERYPTEFNSSQWKTILTHMRVRANLPAVQAKEILKYLQEDSGN
jgi:cytochrome c5